MPMPFSFSLYHNSLTNEYMRLRKGIVLITSNKSRPVDQPLEASPGIETLVVTYNDMCNESVLEQIDRKSPKYRLLYALVEWGAGLSPPYIEMIESTDKELRITFQNGDSIDILETHFFMKKMFQYVKYEGVFRQVPLQES